MERTGKMVDRAHEHEHTMLKRNRNFIFICFLILVLVGVGYWQIKDKQTQIEKQQTELAHQQHKLDRFAVKLRNSAVEGCKRQNEVRKQLRNRIKADLKDTDVSDVIDFFPQINPNVLKRRIQAKRISLHRQIEKIPNAPCEQRYPSKEESHGG